MSEFSQRERRVYETVRKNVAPDTDQRIPVRHIGVHLHRLEAHKIQQAVHDLVRADMLDADQGRVRPVDPDRRIPHPGEVGPE